VTVLVGSEVIDVLHCYELRKGRLSKVKKKGEESVRVRGVCTFRPRRFLYLQDRDEANLHLEQSRESKRRA
jgi:hypothetical protein